MSYAQLVYYSTGTGTTRRFVERCVGHGATAVAIPVAAEDPAPVMEAPYLLVVPSYGNVTALNPAAAATGKGPKENHIPRPVHRFLACPVNREHLAGVIGTGNIAFGEHYCRAGALIAAKVSVPLLRRVDLAGDHADVEAVLDAINSLLTRQDTPTLV